MKNIIDSTILPFVVVILMGCLCCNCSRKAVSDNTSYADSLVGIVEYDPDGEFNNTIDDSDTIEPREPNEPEINFNPILRIPDLEYGKKIFVQFEIKFNTVVRDTIIVDSIAHMYLFTIEMPDSVLTKDSSLQRKVYDRLIHNTYTTKEDIQGKRIFGTAVVLRGK